MLHLEKSTKLITLTRVLLIILGGLFASCGRKADPINASFVVKEAPIPNQLQLVDEYSNLRRSEETGNFLYDHTSNLKIQSYKIPIFAIYIGNKKQEHLTIYECPGTTAEECYVDITGDSLKTLLAAADQEIEWQEEEKTEMLIEHVQIRMQPWDLGEGRWKSSIRASGEILGKTYYTKADGTVSTEGPAEDAAWELSGSDAQSPLKKPFTIKPGEAVSIKLYMDTANLATLTLDAYDISSGDYCVGDREAAICPTISKPVATIDEGDITTEHYLLSMAEHKQFPGKGCLGYMGLYLNSDGEPFGGYLRNYSNPMLDCGGSTFPVGDLSNISENSDGTVNFDIHALSSITEKPDYSYQNFKRQTHTNTMKVNSSPIDELKGFHIYKADRL